MKPSAKLALAALPLVGLVELGAHFFFASRAPAFDAYSQLAPVVAEMRRDGDLVIVAPRWADPAARRALGPVLMPIRDEGRPDVSRYAGAIEIDVASNRAEEVASFREVAARDVGPFRVRRLENPSPARVAYDFVDHVDARAEATFGGQPCSWNPQARVQSGGLGGHPTFPAARFECPGGPFFNVGVTVIADEKFRARRCIWAHPPQRGELVIRFKDVPLGDEIRGHGGMYWIIEREQRGAPVKLEVRVDGDPVGTYEHADGDGWKAFSFALGKHAKAPAATVEFATSSANYRDRHFCFEADTR